MRRVAWAGIGLIVAVVIAGTALIVPAGGLGLSPTLTVASTSPPQPVWNSGNLCKAVFNTPNPGDIQCVSSISDSKVPLSYNFSVAGKIHGSVINVTISGSNDCINMNFHSFHGFINVQVLGSGYACPKNSSSGASGGSSATAAIGGVTNWGGGGWQGGKGCSSSGGGWSLPEWGHGGGGACCSQGGGWSGSWFSTEWSHGGQGNVTCGPGINIAVNSESDVLNLTQGSTSYCGDHGARGYATNVTLYARTIVANVVQYQNNLNTTITYIGSTAGFATCPYSYENGRVYWTESAYGNKDTFNTIFVNQAGAKNLPPNSPYSTEPLGPPDGNAYGYGDLYGNETTTTAPPGACEYIGV